jgi:hypothetical protein
MIGPFFVRASISAYPTQDRASGLVILSVNSLRVPSAFFTIVPDIGKIGFPGEYQIPASVQKG